MRTGYLLDTSQFSHAIMPGSRVRDGLRLRLASGVRVGVYMPVLCEIEAGINGVRDPNRYRDHLQRALQKVRAFGQSIRTPLGSMGASSANLRPLDASFRRSISCLHRLPDR